MDRQRRKSRLNRPRRPEQMPQRAFRRTHIDLSRPTFPLRPFQQQALDRPVLRRVAERRARGVRVDVVHFARGRGRDLQCAPHGAVGARAVGRRRGHMERVGRAGVAREFGVDARAARARVLEVLENQDGGALGHDEARAVAVEGAGRVGGCVVEGCGQGPGAGEAAEGEGVDAGFGTAGEHDGGVSVSDETRCVADGVGAGCAGCCCGVGGALCRKRGGGCVRGVLPAWGGRMNGWAWGWGRGGLTRKP